ncbi:STAS domain-containing protein [Rhodocaloribacter sp.]
MPFKVKEEYYAVVIEITGKFLGAIESEAFKQTIEQLKEAGKVHVVIDLSKADLLDSTAIGLLISSLTTMRRAGGDVRLAGMQKRVRNLFLMTRLLGPVFTNYETVEEAVNSFAEQPEAPADA